MSKYPLILLAFFLSSVPRPTAVDIPPFITVDPFDSSNRSSHSIAPISSRPSSSSRSSSRSSSSSSPSVQPFAYLASDVPYGPFNVGDSDFTMKLKYRLNISSQNVKERLRILDGKDEVVYAKTNSSYYYSKGQTKEVSFNIPLKSYFSNEGLSIRVEILNSGNAVLCQSTQKIYPRNKKYIEYQTLKNSQYVSKNIAIFTDDKSLSPVFEQIDFRTLGEYLDIDYYYRLDLSSVNLGYSCIIPFSCKSASLIFNDDENLFPYLSHDNQNNVITPLIIKKEDTSLRFSFKNNYYVDPKTLTISEYYRPNYRLSSSFYLPMNGKNIFNNKKIYIDVVELGADQISTKIELKYDVARSFVGLCHEAEHCLVGEINND